MNEFHEKFNANVAAINDGSIRFRDVLVALKDEYDLELEFR